MSDRLALANAIEDAGVERAKAERIATVILMRFQQLRHQGGRAGQRGTADGAARSDRTHGPGGMTRMSDLYDDDILLWSEQQADALRRRAANEIDWDNVAEEIGDVGSGRLHAVESLLVQALRHMLKAEAWPLSRDAPSWRADAIDFRQQARRRFVPSMRQRIDVAGLYADAVRALPEKIDEVAPLLVPQVCPVTLDELLALPPEAA